MRPIVRIIEKCCATSHFYSRRLPTKACDYFRSVPAKLSPPTSEEKEQLAGMTQ